MNTIYTVGINFIIYSILGWCCEVAFAAIVDGKFVNRGFLFGPYCPIYGFGVSFVLLCLNPIKDNFIVLFFCSVILTSLLEFITGYVLEKLFHQRWWDYSKERFNIKGYVCLKFSIMWGLACLIVVDIVHPVFERLVSHIPMNVGIIILIIFGMIYISDFITTIIGINKMGKYMKLLANTAEHLNKISVSVGENISDGTLTLMKNADNIKQEFISKNEKLKQRHQEQKKYISEKYAELAKSKTFTAKRIQSAFPDLKILEKENRIYKFLNKKFERDLDIDADNKDE